MPSHMYKVTITLSIYAYILLSEIRITHKNSIVIKCFFVCLLYLKTDRRMAGG